MFKACCSVRTIFYFNGAQGVYISGQQYTINSVHTQKKKSSGMGSCLVRWEMNNSTHRRDKIDRQSWYKHVTVYL